MIGILAAALAWLGASFIVLADGRRGLAAGVGLATVGVSWLAWQSGAGAAAAALVIGGAAASYLRLRSGAQGWKLMPPGSTPRLVLCIGGGLIGLWFAATVTSGAGSPLRFASVVLIGMLGTRIVTSRQPEVVLTAAGVLALALALATALESGAPGAAAYVAAGLIAAGAALVRGTERQAA
ncbi:MAG: hypothetical protein ACHQ0J_06135 [Candidatus Dormibacterales bacterium]